MRRGLTLFALLLLTACSAGSDPPASKPAEASQPARTAGDHQVKITVGSAERTFSVHAPAGYDRAKPTAAVVALHYRPGNAPAMRALTGFDAAADKNGFLVAYPEGVGGQFNAFGCCGAQDDVAFVQAVTERLVADWNADPDRIYLAGVSNGAEMAFRAAVEVPGVFAAIGAVSGGFSGGRTEAADYRPAKPVSVVTLIGAADPQAEALKTGVATWRSRLGCQAKTETPAGVTYTNGRCGDGSDVDAYVVEGAGHVWFGAKSGPELADPTSKIVATDILWAFFAAHTRRG